MGAFGEEVKKTVQSPTFVAGILLKTNDDRNFGPFESWDVIENTEEVKKQYKLARSKPERH